MNSPAFNRQEKTALEWPASRAVCETSGAIMTEKQSIWQLANKQAAQVGKIKNNITKSRQVVLLCETLKRALKGDS